MLIGNTTFRGNIAWQGGAFYSTSSVIFTNQTLFVNNSALTTGGAIQCNGCSQLRLEMGSVMMSNTAATDGGGLSCDGCSEVQLDHAQVVSNSAGGNGGGVFLSANGATLANITACNMSWNNAALDGGALNVTGGATVLSNNTFTGNSAGVRGGAISYADECATPGVVPFGWASTAAALASAGVSPFSWASSAPRLAKAIGNCSIFISTGDIIQSNCAQAGGAMYSTDMSSTWINCTSDGKLSQHVACSTWGDNSISVLFGYGSTLAFPPATIKRIYTVEIADYINLEAANSSRPLANVPRPPPLLASYTSDGSAMPPIFLGVQDAADNFAIRGGMTVSISAVDANVSGQVQTVTGLSGEVIIDSLILRAAPGYHDLEVSLPDYPQVPNLTLTVPVSPCSNGSVQQETDLCSYCKAPQHSYNPQGSNNTFQCDEPCPANAECSGGAAVVPLAGYWISSPFSDSIVTCPNSAGCGGSRDALTSCLSATNSQSGTPPDQQDPSTYPLTCELQTPIDSTDPTSFMAMQCTPGYYGPACSLCLRNSTHAYGRTGTLSCQHCRSKGFIVLAYIASTLAVLLLLCYTIHVTLKENSEGVEQTNQSAKASELLRALTLWLQYMSLLGQANIPAPDTLHWIFSAASFAFSSITSGSLSTDCLLSLGPTNLAFKRLLLHLAVPPIILIVLIALQLILWWQRRKQATPTNNLPTPVPAHSNTPKDKLCRRMLVTLLTVIFYYYPSILTTTLSLFTCYHLDSSATYAKYPHNAQAAWSHGYWLPDMRKPCWTGWHVWHALPLGIPLLLICLCIFLLPMLLLYKHRHHLKSQSVKYHLGFIYHPYRARFWFWDSIVLLQTFALASAQVFALALDTYFQLTIMLMILVVGFAVLSHLRPFEAAMSQTTQVLGLFSVLATAVGCLYLMDTTNSSSIASKAGLDSVGVLLMLLNVAFVTWMVVLIARAGKHEVKQTLSWLAEKLTSAVWRLCWTRNVSREDGSLAKQLQLSLGRLAPARSTTALLRLEPHRSDSISPSAVLQAQGRT